MNYAAEAHIYACPEHENRVRENIKTYGDDKWNALRFADLHLDSSNWNKFCDRAFNISEDEAQKYREAVKIVSSRL